MSLYLVKEPNIYDSSTISFYLFIPFLWGVSCAQLLEISTHVRTKKCLLGANPVFSQWLLIGLNRCGATILGKWMYLEDQIFLQLCCSNWSKSSTKLRCIHKSSNFFKSIFPKIKARILIPVLLTPSKFSQLIPNLY